MDKKVLHIDDDPTILKIVGHKLRKSGYEVISLEDPDQAFLHIFQNAIRVVILDIDMPKKDGLTLLRDIKHRDGGIQAIMLTGMVSMSTVLQATRLGAEDFVFKPINDLSDITRAVDRSFEKINRWWTALHDWMERMNDMKMTAASTDGFKTPPDFNGKLSFAPEIYS